MLEPCLLQPCFHVAGGCGRWADSGMRSNLDVPNGESARGTCLLLARFESEAPGESLRGPRHLVDPRTRTWAHCGFSLGPVWNRS